jgi:nucleotidyltransferase/DNA polymerase involved in DNA repair
MFATIYLPNFYLQAALRHHLPYRGTVVPAVRLAPLLDSAGETPTCHTDKMSVLPPVALIDENEKKPVIIQLNRAAEAVGVRKGMTPSQGLARCLTLLIKTRSSSQEKTIQEIVFHHAFSLSPYVEATSPGIYTVQFTNDAKQPSRLSGQRGIKAIIFNGQDARLPGQAGRPSSIEKLSRVIDQLAACEVTAQAGLSQTPDTSFLAAHLARPVLEIKDPKEFLAPLSIDTLAIPLQS